MSSDGIAEARMLLSKLDNKLDKIDREPIGDDTELVYAEQCLKIYKPAPYVADDHVLVTHTCRNDMGTVMIKDRSPLYDAIMAVVEDDDEES